jgi:hypothetical protein
LRLLKILGIEKGDWRAIALCVFAAVTFWFFNAMNNDYSIDVTHPVKIIYDEEVFIPLSQPPSELKFSTTASGWDIVAKTSFINTNPIEIELEEFRKNRYLPSNRLLNIVARQMKGIKVNEIHLDTLYVSFDRIKHKKVNLLVDNKKISLAEGYKLAGNINVSPAQVVLSGPASLIKNTSSNIFLTVDEKDISGDYDEDLEITTKLDKRITLNVNKARVKFQTFQLEKIEKELKLEKVNFPRKKKINLSDDKVTFVYYAREEDLPTIEKEKFVAYIDYNQLNDNSKTIKPQLRKIPDLIHKYNFAPVSIKVSYGE